MKSSDETSGLTQVCRSQSVPCRIWLLGFCFFSLFTAYTPFQNYLPVNNADYGSYSLTVLYFMYGLSCSLAPAIVSYLGAENAILLGSSG